MITDKIDTGLYRIKVPFQDLNTTVYVAVYGDGVAIIDSATYPSDAVNYVIPALTELGIDRSRVKYILLTHRHGDHSGGAYALSAYFSTAMVGAIHPMNLENYFRIKDGDEFLGGLRVVSLPGHTEDCVGYLDTRTNTLLSGDCLQLKGVGKYRNGVSDRVAYAGSVNKLMSMDIDRIVAAHEYDPLGSIAEGREGVRNYLKTCLDVLGI